MSVSIILSNKLVATLFITLSECGVDTVPLYVQKDSYRLDLIIVAGSLF